MTTTDHPTVNACAPEPLDHRAAGYVLEAVEQLQALSHLIDVHVRELFGPTLADALLPGADRPVSCLELGLDLYRRAGAEFRDELEHLRERMVADADRARARAELAEAGLDQAVLEAVERARRGRRPLPSWAREAIDRHLRADDRWWDESLPEADRAFLIQCASALVQQARQR